MEIKGYELHDIAGDGRTGRVYHAVRTVDGAKVAFRQVKPRLAREEGVIEAICKLKTDCADLRHVVLVPIVESFVVEGAICVVEPWIEGTSLADRLKDDPLSEEDVVTVGIECCEALEELHDAGLVHGDVSPSNIMLTSRGARLMGLGVAARTHRRRKDKKLTSDPYDAPELKTAGGETTLSTDLYALAACLDAAIKGDATVAPGGGFQLSTGASQDDGLRRVLDEGLSSHPNMRYATARRFKRALLGVQIGVAPPAPSGGLAQGDPDWEDPDEPPRSRPAPPPPKKKRELPTWAPRAAAGTGGVVALLVLGTWLIGLLPDVPDGMVQIPSGSAQVGDPEGQFDERPGFGWTHARFFLDRTEVTVGQYEICVAEGTCSGVGTRLERRQDEPTEPVVGVTWLQAVSYCQSVGRRLPSENEWEAAARHFGGLYASGPHEPGCGAAWFGGWAAGPCGTPGQDALPRAISVDDGPDDVPLHLAGNVWEFTNSDYVPNRRPGTGGLAQAGGSVLKVIKGGAFTTGPEELRSSARLGVEMDHWAGDVGFRCAAEPAKP
jgi:formylglycine-generating enzyme required for sulfatase activity